MRSQREIIQKVEEMLNSGSDIFHFSVVVLITRLEKEYVKNYIKSESIDGYKPLTADIKKIREEVKFNAINSYKCFKEDEVSPFNQYKIQKIFIPLLWLMYTDIPGLGRFGNYEQDVKTIFEYFGWSLNNED